MYGVNLNGIKHPSDYFYDITEIFVQLCKNDTSSAKRKRKNAKGNTIHVVFS